MPSSRPQPAAKRNKLVTVMRLKPNALAQAGGHLDESDRNNWANLTKQWCCITPRGSREFFRNEEVAADISHQVEMLYNSDSKQITVKMLITFDGRTLAIDQPPRNTEENNHSLVFACKEIFPSLFS